LPSKFACSLDNESPNAVAVVVPARHAYSHSISRGSRYSDVAESRPGARSLAVSILQKAVALSHETDSTGNRAPLKRAGFVPITLSYNSCVVSVSAIQNPFVIVTDT
jgi:hypothetical protein